ncbi:hypothetical protein AWC15_13115 [Mycobacterium lacus]|nr:PE family protein [Mycobacterium lacus]MCV7124965.1 PE family protein [Mycobacterium lacus]ORW14425.1 hypothetical protein AWC15_13115 [Mycobacterium lacus]
MSFVVVTPELLAAGAADVARIGWTINAANSAAAVTTAVLPAAGDEVSAAIAALFGTHAAEYQAVSAQVALFHARFVQTRIAMSARNAASASSTVR